MSIRSSLLALLDQGPAYGNQLRTRLEERTGGSWPLNIGQVYQTLDRLVRDGLVGVEGDLAAELPARAGAVYRITETGRALVARWFAEPVPRGAAPRDELAIKRAQLAADPAAARRPWMLVLDRVLFDTEAELRWLDHCEATLPTRREAVPRPTTEDPDEKPRTTGCREQRRRDLQRGRPDDLARPARAHDHGPMGYLDISRVTHALPDGRVLLDEVSFKVAEGRVTALVGANGSGKSTLMRLISGDEPLQSGAITRVGPMGVMRQFVGHMTAGTVRDLLLAVAPPTLAATAAELDAAELAMMDADDEATQMRYAQAISDWAEHGGYDLEVVWDVVTVAALGTPFASAQYREVSTLSGGEQKRVVLEALLRGPDEVLLLDEPDNYLDVPGKLWLEQRLRESPKTVLLISHDRELLANAADVIVTIELGAAGNTAWTHPGSFTTYHDARAERFARLDELTRRWDEEHVKLKELVQYYKTKAAYNDGMSSRLQAARSRLARFEEAGPPEAQPLRQAVAMRLRGGRTGKRAVVCQGLTLSTPTGERLVEPFDLEVWFADRVAVLGANGSGKSHFLRLLAAGGSSPDLEHEPVSDVVIEPVVHAGAARLGARVRPGWFAQTHSHPEWAGRTLLEILHRGDEHRDGMGRETAARVLDRYELARSGEQRFESLSGGQQARFQVLLLELSGATLLLLDEPTDNLDMASAEALEEGLAAFTGTVLAVTHDRWFTRGFDRFLVFGADGRVREVDSPVWLEPRATR